MPMNVFRKSSGKTAKKKDTSFLVQKPFSRTNYLENKLEEDFDMIIEHRRKNKPETVYFWEAIPKFEVDILYIHPGIKNTAHDFNDEDLNNVGFVQVNSMPSVGEYSTTIFFMLIKIFLTV